VSPCAASPKYVFALPTGVAQTLLSVLFRSLAPLAGTLAFGPLIRIIHTPSCTSAINKKIQLRAAIQLTLQLLASTLEPLESPQARTLAISTHPVSLNLKDWHDANDEPEFHISPREACMRPELRAPILAAPRVLFAPGAPSAQIGNSASYRRLKRLARRISNRHTKRLEIALNY
jgi:hypothetical protein